MESSKTNGAAHCPVCDAKVDAEVMRSNGYPILRCGTCALAFTDDRTAPPPSELYPPFDQTEAGAVKTVRSAFSVFLRQREAFVKSLKPSGRLLDYGCGNGAFARWMSQSGFEAVGMEPFSLGKTTVEGGLQLVRAPLESASPTLGQFDVITMWHVLEHVPRPVELLEKLKQHLAPDGVLIVSVPNFQSWQSALFKAQWFHLDPPRHLIHFEPHTLAGTLSRAGFTQKREVRFLPEYGSSGWVQSALNKVLPHHNYLYELVKDRGALKEMSPASSALHFAASVLAGAPLFALSLPLEAASTLSNKGAALTLAVGKA